MHTAKRRGKRRRQQVEALKEKMEIQQQMEALKQQVEVLQKELKIQKESSKKQINISVQEHINAILPVVLSSINQFNEKTGKSLINSSEEMIKKLFKAYITGRDNAKKAINKNID